MLKGLVLSPNPSNPLFEQNYFSEIHMNKTFYVFGHLFYFIWIKAKNLQNSINFISRVRVGYFWSLFWDFYHEIKCMSKSTVIFALGIFWRQTITKTLNNTGQVLKGIWGQRVLIKYKFNRTSFWAKLLVDKKLFLLEFFGSLYFIA